MLLARWRWVLLLVAILLPVRVARATLESSFWHDEIYSAMVAGLDLPELLDVTATIDLNPPGYYLVLKAWTELGRRVGLEPGVLWARLPGVGAWLLLCALTFGICRKLYGPTVGAIAAWAVGAGAQAGYMAKDMRSYGLAHVGCFACLLFLLWADRADRTGSASEQRSAWLGYGVAAAVAFLTHALTLPLVALIAVLWLALGVRPLRPRFLLLGALAHAAAALTLIPLVLAARSQLGLSTALVYPWVTPPTFGNLVRVFALWYPFGQFGGAGIAYQVPARWTTLSGSLSVLVPMACWLWSLRAPGRGPDSKALGVVAAAGLALPTAYTLLLWGITRAGGPMVFHGPRYPALAVSCWALGLAALSVLACARLGWSEKRAVLLLLPWFVCSAAGQAVELHLESRAGLAEAMPAQMPPPGGLVYLSPDELIPFYRRTFRDYVVRPVVDLAQAPQSGVVVLVLNPFLGVARPQELVFRELLHSHRLSAQVEPSRPPLLSAFPPSERMYQAYRLDGLHLDVIREHARRGFAPPPRPATVGATDLAMRDGWGPLQVDGPTLAVFREQVRPAALVRLPEPTRGPRRVCLPGPAPREDTTVFLRAGPRATPFASPAGATESCGTVDIAEDALTILRSRGRLRVFSVEVGPP